MTAKQLEQDTGCKIMVRGKGSMRDKKKEDQNRGKPNWEHLNEELHVLITVEDTHNRYVFTHTHNRYFFAHTHIRRFIIHSLTKNEKM